MVKHLEKGDQDKTLMNMTDEKLLFDEPMTIQKSKDPSHNSFDDIDIVMSDNSNAEIDMAKYTKKGSGDHLMDDLEQIALSEGCVSDNEEDDPKQYLPNVLVADDNPVELKTLIEQVKYIKGPDMKYQSCDFAEDGNGLIDMYNKRLKLAMESNWKIRPYTVIISDLHMPGCNGFEAVNKICQSFESALDNASDNKKSALRPKIIIHSGEKNNSLKDAVEASTTMRFIYKPASIDQIQELVGPHLQPLQRKD
jgi:CheY-like chemotaxis protein